MKKLLPFLLLAATPVFAADIFVAADKGDDTADGSAAHPLKTISAAAEKAMPGDTVTVHAGIYRERVNPPRGGTDDAHRITYQAAKGEKVVITGSERIAGWTRVRGDTWKVVIPNARFGGFNPFAETIRGDWFSPHGPSPRLGGVWLGETRLTEAANLEQTRGAPGASPLWFAKVDGIKVPSGHASLFNIATFKVGAGAPRRASAAAAREGTRNAGCSEGGECVGYISPGQWLRYDDVDFGEGAESVAFRVSAPEGAGGLIELRQGHPDGPLLGVGVVPGAAGGWQDWRTVTAKIKKTSGTQSVYLVFKDIPAGTTDHPGADASAKTEIFAQFPGVDPNTADVEVTFRPTVFTPEKTGIDYITLRGFELCNAATNWAGPCTGQRGLVTAYWSKGWIIEDNDIHDSRCSGIALGKYSDSFDGKRGSTEGYVQTIRDALATGGWSKDKVGSHIVRRNHIHDCGQAGVVGSMGCAFSTIEDNDIHDIYWRQPFGGAEMACIKFHGGVDVVIRDNHLWHCANTGIWLDWMAQGAQITGNLVHDIVGPYAFVISMEVDHGPALVANNILLGGRFQLCGSNGTAYVHNLGTFRLWDNWREDLRRTPFMKPHSTTFAGDHTTPCASDDRIYNNVSAGTDWRIYDAVFEPGKGKLKPLMDSWLAGNVYLKGAVAPVCETDAVSLPQRDAGLKLVRKDDGWYLSLAEDAAWKTATKRKLVTTAMLGKAAIPDVPFENPDGSPIVVDTDYFGKKRDTANPFPGPFETPVNGEVKVWPK